MGKEKAGMAAPRGDNGIGVRPPAATDPSAQRQEAQQAHPFLEIEKHHGSLPHCRVAAGSWQGRPPGSSASLVHPFRCFSPQFSYLSLASLNLARPQRFAPWHGRTGSVQTGSVNN